MEIVLNVQRIVDNGKYVILLLSCKQDQRRILSDVSIYRKHL